MESFEVRTRNRSEFVDITGMVSERLRAKGIRDGACLIYVPHTTAGVTINENADPDVQRDVQAQLSRIAPQEGHYRHVEGNADGHVKSTLVGASQIIPIEGGRLSLGQWQGIYFCEFDGPRTRRVYLQWLSGA
ncbi:MAG: YjbQ family protein [Planctomycetes bacterium]|nr:YjbQ family protein [Planctomycetota bacterium]